jgi:hypothetical protein
MHRNIFFILTFFISGLAWSQQSQPAANLPVDAETKMIQFREVVEQEGDKDVLYDRGASWFSSYYKSPVSVLKIQDKVNGKIEGTGRCRIVYTDEQGLIRDAGIILYNIKMELKDNKYRYTLTDFTLKSTSRYPIEKWMNKNDPAYNPLWDSYLYQIDTTMQSLIHSMKEGMKPKVIKKDEW